jgi:uncharacterized protein (TIGR03437 family)
MKRMIGIGFLLVAVAAGQELNTAALTGKYFVHEVTRTSANGTLYTDQRSLTGTILFDGSGQFNFNGTRKIGQSGAADVSAAGTYSMNSAGVVRLTNLQGSGPDVAARWAPEMMVGSATEAGGVFDLFVAIPAPAGVVLPNAFDGSYRMASVEFVAGTAAVSRAAYFTATIVGATFGSAGVTGIASNLPAGLQQGTFNPAVLQLTLDGRGQMTVPGTEATALFAGPKTMLGSATGRVVLVVPETAGVHGLAVGVRTMAGASNASLAGLYWTAGLRHQDTQPGTFVGTLNSPGNGTALTSRRARELAGATNFSGRVDYQIAPAGVGTAGGNYFAIGGEGALFVASGAVGGDVNYELQLGVRAPAIRVTSAPFLHPIGAVHSASFAPSPNPVAPGQLVDLFGANLGSTTLIGSSPLPNTLAGIQVLINEQPAPVYAVAPDRIKFVIPQAARAGSVAVTAVVNGTRSNTIALAIAATSPGLFASSQNGIGIASALRADGGRVTANNPARRGETVQLFLTGLGITSPALGDGVAAPGGVSITIPANVNIYVRGAKAEVVSTGLAAGLVGVAQIGVVIPASVPGGTWPVAVETGEGFSDQADMAVAP